MAYHHLTCTTVAGIRFNAFIAPNHDMSYFLSGWSALLVLFTTAPCGGGGWGCSGQDRHGHGGDEAEVVPVPPRPHSRHPRGQWVHILPLLDGLLLRERL